MGRPVNSGGLRVVVVLALLGLGLDLGLELPQAPILALLGLGLDLGHELPQAPIRLASELKSGFWLGLVA